MDRKESEYFWFKGSIEEDSDCHEVKFRPDNSSAVRERTIVPSPIPLAPEIISPPTDVKRRRGRPRKYDPHGKEIPAPGIDEGSDCEVVESRLDNSSAVRERTIVPSPIPPASEIISPSTDVKRRRGRPRKYDPQEILALVTLSSSAGRDFTSHEFTVNTGEDIYLKIMQMCPPRATRAICILSANGAISRATVQHSPSNEGIKTYEGRYDILTLSGSIVPYKSGGIIRKSGGICLSMASPEGQVIGGRLVGMLIAASPVQLVVGSFIPCPEQEDKLSSPSTNILSNPTGGLKPVVTSAFTGDIAGSSNPIDGKNPVVKSSISGYNMDPSNPISVFESSSPED